MDQAKERAREFIGTSTIEGNGSSGGPIITNLDYLRENLDHLLTF
jgi:hypothetical protein